MHGFTITITRTITRSSKEKDKAIDYCWHFMDVGPKTDIIVETSSSLMKDHRRVELELAVAEILSELNQQKNNLKISIAAFTLEKVDRKE